MWINVLPIFWPVKKVLGAGAVDGLDPGFRLCVECWASDPELACGLEELHLFWHSLFYSNALMNPWRSGSGSVSRIRAIQNQDLWPPENALPDGFRWAWNLFLSRYGVFCHTWNPPFFMFLHETQTALTLNMLNFSAMLEVQTQKIVPRSSRQMVVE